jgi:hypothetical protein
MSSFSATGASYGFIIRAVLIADDTISTESMSLGRTTGRADSGLLTGKLVCTIIIVSPVEGSFPPYNGMGFYFLGYGGWILAEGICDTDIGHLVVQRILNNFPFLSSQVFILFHSQSLLKTETQ